MDTSGSAETATVYWALDGGIHHAKCGQRMVLRARRQEELEFACLACAESVSLPLSSLAQLPVAT